MIFELVSVLLGVACGTIAGVLPGVGITVSLVLMYPVIATFDVMQLILFYIALAATVQYTGTIPSVFFGVPGESNSLPASIEGPKFSRKNLAMLAIGGCQISSIIGATIGSILTLSLLYLLIPYLQYFFNGTFKLFLYLLVILFLLFIYNQGKILVNLLLVIAGAILALPGESEVASGTRFTFGFTDLDYGIPLLPVLIGFLVIPTIFKNHQSQKHAIPHTVNVPGVRVVKWVKKNITSVLRGSTLGYFCGFVPGMGTTLATNATYSLEKKLHPANSGKQLLSAESANNSASLASWLPLLLLGIPITGSEVIVYGMLVDAGWDPLRINTVEEAMTGMFRELAIWYVIINFIVLIVAWPFAKKVAVLISCNYNILLLGIMLILFIVNAYLGYLDFRFWLFQLCFFVFCTIGYILRKYNCLPLIFMFIIALDFEAVAYRFWLSNF